MICQPRVKALDLRYHCFMLDNLGQYFEKFKKYGVAKTFKGNL